MYRIGIDVGSTYTKYCVMDEGHIISLFSEKTPIRQRSYFDGKLRDLLNTYPDAEIISCGYGKRNVSEMQSVNELTALAKGVYHLTERDGIVLDVGGQDTKIIVQKKGVLKEFFINDKCAAGSGMFLANVLQMVGRSFGDIHIKDDCGDQIHISSTCAVFAQSEIVELIANNKTEEEIILAVLWQIFVKAKPLLAKVELGSILLSGGLSQIDGIEKVVRNVLGRECFTVEDGTYLAAIGSVL